MTAPCVLCDLVAHDGDCSCVECECACHVEGEIFEHVEKNCPCHACKCACHGDSAHRVEDIITGLVVLAGRAREAQGNTKLGVSELVTNICRGLIRPNDNGELGCTLVANACRVALVDNHDKAKFLALVETAWDGLEKGVAKRRAK